MKHLLYLLLILLFISCKSEYKKGLEFIRENDFENAILHLNSVNSNEKDYENAQLKLREIDNLKEKIAFEKAKNLFTQKNYNEALLLFTGFGTQSTYFDEAEKYIILINRNLKNIIVEKDDTVANNDKSLALAKKKVLKLFDELQQFKNKDDFHQYGFAINYKYNYWLEEIEILRKDNKIVNKLYDEGYSVIDLQALGLEYVSSGGKETNFSRHVLLKFKNINIEN